MTIAGLSLLLVSLPMAAWGCGLDWSLPMAHYEGVEEHGYVAYWENLGNIDLGDGLIIPVHIGFNSHRETSSPTLGKGWIVALLESHVEPIDENCMNVIMPDGWTFVFYRNGNTETWRGNSGWVGETNDTIFTIAAPCGWRIKFDQGKIQEIDGARDKALTWRYNGGIATEIDAGSRAIVQVDPDPATGAAADIVIDGKKIDISMARRPQVVTKLTENLIVGFDPCLSALHWPEGRTETFGFGTNAELCPTLAIGEGGVAKWNFIWDPQTRQIKTDGTWTYNLKQVENRWHFDRIAANGQSESYESDDVRGVTREKGPDGREIITTRFPAGPLAGVVRKIEEAQGRDTKLLYSASYFPSGAIMRDFTAPGTVRELSEKGQLMKETVAGQVVYEQDDDDQGRLLHIFNPARQIEVKRTYDAQGGQTTQVFKAGALFYTEQVDHNNRLVSLDEGGKP
jgi:hypothetical protein